MENQENKISSIHIKMCRVMSEIGAIEKSNTNTFQNYKFRGIDDFLNALHPILVKHEIFLNPRVVSEHIELKDRDDGKKGVTKHVHLKVEYDFVSSDGSQITVGPVMGEGLDTSDKAMNKAHSSALKNLVIETFLIPTKDNADSDFESPQISYSYHSKDKSPNATAGTPFPQTQKENKPQNNNGKNFSPSAAQLGRLFAIGKKAGWSNPKIKDYMIKMFNKESTKDLTRLEYDALCNHIEDNQVK